MKVAFILPAVGKAQGEPYIRSWKMEPLMMAVLKALTPADIQTAFYDDRVELLDEQINADLVAISVETYTAQRAYSLAARYRRRGIPVILGGYHVTLCPEEAAANADSVLIGDAEGIWRQVLEDAGKGNLKRSYQDADEDFVWTSPDRSIYAHHVREARYTPLTLIETSRGCPLSCEFCAIASFHRHRYRTRPIGDVLDEIRRIGKRYFFIVDDNFMGNRERSKELLKALAPLKIRWAGQGTLQMAEDEELLELLKRSGCMMLLIGFESTSPSNLKQMHKQWLTSLGDAGRLVRRIHAKGISIYATFVFGYDEDDRDAFRQAVAFCLEHRFFFAAFNHLLPWPGTPLYDRLKHEGRLTSERWWLDPAYSYGDYAFRPARMSCTDLKDACTWARMEFFALGNIFRRGLALLERTRDPALNGVYYAQNLLLKNEIRRKLDIPIGKGLDELPK